MWAFIIVVYGSFITGVHPEPLHQSWVQNPWITGSKITASPTAPDWPLMLHSALNYIFIFTSCGLVRHRHRAAIAHSLTITFLVGLRLCCSKKWTNKTHHTQHLRQAHTHTHTHTIKFFLLRNMRKYGSSSLWPIWIFHGYHAVPAQTEDRMYKADLFIHKVWPME